VVYPSESIVFEGLRHSEHLPSIVYWESDIAGDAIFIKKEIHQIGEPVTFCRKKWTFLHSHFFIRNLGWQETPKLQYACHETYPATFIDGLFLKPYFFW
jgi:hypothetical protein